MTDSERASAIQRLVEGRDALLQALEGLSAPQLAFRPEPDRWSIADCVEHIAVTEDIIFALIISGVANPDGVSLDPGKDERLAAAILGRERKVQAPEPLRPKGSFASAAHARDHFRASRERTIAYVRECPDDLRRLFCMHPVLGEIDCHRCLVLLSLHPVRHAAQIQEIKSHAAFPR